MNNSSLRTALFGILSYLSYTKVNSALTTLIIWLGVYVPIESEWTLAALLILTNTISITALLTVILRVLPSKTMNKRVLYSVIGAFVGAAVLLASFNYLDAHLIELFELEKYTEVYMSTIATSALMDVLFPLGALIYLLWKMQLKNRGLKSEHPVASEK